MQVPFVSAQAGTQPNKNPGSPLARGRTDSPCKLKTHKLKTHKLKTHKLKTHKLKTHKLKTHKLKTHNPVDVMSDLSFTLFDTAIGVCAIVWGAHGIAGVQLPEQDAAMTRARVLRRFAGAQEAPPPADVRYAIDGIVALLRGERRNLSDIVIDDADIPDFNRRVYAIARQIPPGATMTYGEIAERLGNKTLARAVGQAMGENPTPIIMPCHRVLAAGGKSGGFSASGGVVTKLRLLSIEGAQPGGPTLFDHLPLAARNRR
jgi:methylated-DNA-[protein]-cysteine S-methyltransferase